MTHPLTPREKVEPFERYPALASWIAKMASVGSGLSLGEWMTFVGALNAAIVQAEQRTALASGSGDHAELARLAETNKAYGFLVSVQPEIVLSLLADIAALRAEHVHLVEQKEGAEDALFNALSRATEAERKLAEAVGLLREWMGTWFVDADSRGESAIADDTRKFLSKEAERG